MTIVEEVGFTRAFYLSCVLAAGQEAALPGSPPRRMPLLITPSGYTDELFAGELSACGVLQKVGASNAGATGRRVVVLNGYPWELAEDLDHALLTELLAGLAGTCATDLGRSQVAVLWRAMCLGEVLSYLASDLADHQFDPAWALHSIGISTDGLAKHSAAKLFYLCHLAVRDMASHYLRRASPAASLSSTLLEFLGRRFASSYAEQWHTSFNRHRRQGESAAAILLAEVVTSLGPAYLKTVPTSEGIVLPAFGGRRTTVSN